MCVCRILWAQSLINHFRLMVDCCHPHQPWWLGGSDSTQLMINNSGCMVTVWLMVDYSGPSIQKRLFQGEWFSAEEAWFTLESHRSAWWFMDGGCQRLHTASLTQIPQAPLELLPHSTSNRDLCSSVNPRGACSLDSTKHYKSYKLLGKCVQAIFLSQTQRPNRCGASFLVVVGAKCMSLSFTSQLISWPALHL